MFFLLEMVRCYDALPDGLQTHQDTHLSGTRDKGRLMLGVGNNFSPALSKMHTSNHQMKSCVGFFLSEPCLAQVQYIAIFINVGCKTYAEQCHIPF